MNYKTILSLTLAISIPVFAAESPEERQYKREKEAKEQSKKESEQAAILEAAAEKPVPTQMVAKPYPQTQQRLKDLQAKIERLGKEEITAQELLKLSTADLESEIRKRGTKKLSAEELLLYDTLMFGELAEIFGEAQGLQKEVCEYLTGWHEVGQFKGHNGVINALATYWDNKKNKEKLVTGGQDGAVKIWDIDTQTCEYTLPTESHPVTALLTFFENNKQYIAVAYSTYVKLFTLRKKEAPTLSKMFTGNPSPITHMEVQYWRDPNNSEVSIPKLCAFSAGNMTIRIWDITTGQFTESFGVYEQSIIPWPAQSKGIFQVNPATGAIQCSALPEHTATTFSNYINLRWSIQKHETSNYLFASGDAQGNIYIWDTGKPSCITKLEGHTAKITSLAITSVTIHAKKLLPLQYPCSCPCSACKSTYKEEKPGHFNIISTAPKDHCTSCIEKYDKSEQESLKTVQLISASEDGTVRLWEMSEGTKVLPAVITQEKEVAENPKYLDVDDIDCNCELCCADSDSDDEDEESSEDVRKKVKEHHGS